MLEEIIAKKRIKVIKMLLVKCALVTGIAKVTVKVHNNKCLLVRIG